MAYHTITDGMDELLKQMTELGDAGRAAAAAGLYEASGVYAGEVSKGIDGISVEPFKYAKGGQKRKPSPEEKAIISGHGAIGIAKFHKSGFAFDTSIGFNGSGYAPVNWNHMSSRARTNSKLLNESHATWSGRAYLKKQADGSVIRDRGKGGLQNAKPVEMIANAINSGTSFMSKDPFFRKAISRGRAKAEAAFEAKAVEILDKAANENK